MKLDGPIGSLTGFALPARSSLDASSPCLPASRRFSMSNERCINVTITAVLLLVLTVSVARAQAPDPPFARALFTQLDAVQSFDLATGKGIQVSTVTGIIAGTSYVETQVVVTG